MRNRARFVSVGACALAAATCGNSSSTPTSPGTPSKSSNYHGTLLSTNYAPTPLDIALTATGGAAAQPVTGSYSTGNGITGQVTGTLTGSLDGGGSFSGTLTYNTSPLGGTNCNGTGAFSGNVSSAGGVDWTSSGFTSSCAGDPKGVHATAPPGGTGPSPTPTPAAVNVAGTWAQDGKAILALTQVGNTVTGMEITPNLSGIVFTTSLTGTVSGTTFTALLTGSFTIANPGAVPNPIMCGGLSQIISAQVTNTTMTGTVTNSTTLTCNVNLGQLPIQIGVPESFTLTKQ